MNDKKPKLYEDVRQEVIDFQTNWRLKNLLRQADKLSPIEGIVLLSIFELSESFGHYNFRTFLPQVKIGKYTVDFLIEYAPLENDSVNKKIIIECDGHEFHEKTKKQAEHDKTRDRYFTKLGYIVLRYTGSELVRDRFKVWKDVEELFLPEQHKESFGYGVDFEKMVKEMRL